MLPTMPPRSPDRYRIVGPCYELFCGFYSAARIQRCRMAMIERIKPGERVLFAGVGGGSEAVVAAARGAAVSAVDTSEAMLRRLRRKLALTKTAIQVDVRNDDVRNLTEYDQFDWVFANFFLNVFDPIEMRRVLSHLSRLARIKGHVVIGDFRPLHGSALHRALQRAYWYAALLPFAIVVGNAIHPIYDYSTCLPTACLQMVETRSFVIAGVDLYWSILTRRYSPEPDTAIGGDRPG